MVELVSVVDGYDGAAADAVAVAVVDAAERGHSRVIGIVIANGGERLTAQINVAGLLEINAGEAGTVFSGLHLRAVVLHGIALFDVLGHPEQVGGR